jgi:hypothetical protein
MKWWNDHILKRGPDKDMSVYDYVAYLDGLLRPLPPHEKANKMRPVITGFFDIFSTKEYRDKKLFLGEEDFVNFWVIFADVDEHHCRRVYTKYFPAPLTMEYFLADFEAFVSNPEFVDENSKRVFHVFKQPNPSGCCKA